MSAPTVRAAPGGATLAVRVAPGARSNRIVGVHGGALKVAVQAPPERGKANREVARLLAAAVGAQARDVAVVRGATARDKVLLFRGWNATDLRARIVSALGPA
ncbi:MAG: DUF167 domain-containing protein [Planctomycetota bacterium]